MKETKVGSHTRAQLKKLKRKLKTGRLTITGLSGPTLSRALAGRKRPSRETMWKLVAALDPQSGSELMAAYSPMTFPRICGSGCDPCATARRVAAGIPWFKRLARFPDIRASLERNH
jgi:hypothetical protein